MLLAIDPGRSLGFASEHSRGIKTGVQSLTGSSEGAVFLAARQWMREALMGPIHEVILEAPILPHGKTVSIASRLVLFGIRAHLIAVAHERNVSVTEVEPAKWRKPFLGCARAPRGVKDGRAWLKARALEECRLRGFDVSGPDEAEAAGILVWAQGRRSNHGQQRDLFPDRLGA
ncbi:hypothetical protein [Chelatococcus asaccharovorans]|uniref:Holliday junction resolvasome RuvABC endonuclease subunit n=1 Tax=Chelatococcus asaccharovorans TaxID=28210 RepID=A0A2V3UAR8_9HYPH|nr:hypothetical protein [Chelatococcus asaccharovorans]MBS7703272.1 hypothetical protein [Chelatococcus asaccharovorans]PXW61603.1 hypothetical protein C7450_103120 [Chelatococcus asaccharovorans]